MQWDVGINLPEKIKIKQSEIDELYEIESDKPKSEEVYETISKNDDYEITIKEEDAKLEKEFEEEWV